MQVILKSDVKGLGKALDLVNVKNGYAQNYLFPRQMASLATKRNIGILEKDRETAEKFYLKEKKAAEEISAKLSELSLTIAARVSDGDKLYGSVTPKEISAKIKEHGIDIDRKQIQIDEPFKKLGMYNITVTLPPDVNTQLKLWIISDESEKVAS